MIPNNHNDVNEALRSVNPCTDRLLFKDQKHKHHHLNEQHQLESHEQSSSVIMCSKDQTSKNNTDQQYRDAVRSLGPYDVVCGRGSVAFNNIGNRRFRIIIGMNVDKYSAIDGRFQKGIFIGNLVDALVCEMGARFFKQNKTDGRLVELTEAEIRKKVGHALRDMFAFQESQQQQQQQDVKEQNMMAGDTATLAIPSLLSPARSPAHHKKSNDMNCSCLPHERTQQSLPQSLPHFPLLTSLLFQESIESIDVPRNFRADANNGFQGTNNFEIQNRSTDIRQHGFFPVSNRDKRQRQKELQRRLQQQQQQSGHFSMRELEERLSATTNISNSERERQGTI